MKTCEKINDSEAIRIIKLEAVTVCMLINTNILLQD